MERLKRAVKHTKSRIETSNAQKIILVSEGGYTAWSVAKNAHQLFSPETLVRCGANILATTGLLIVAEGARTAAEHIKQRREKRKSPD